MNQEIVMEDKVYTSEELQQFEDDNRSFYFYKNKLFWVPFALLPPVIIFFVGINQNSAIISMGAFFLAVVIVVIALVIDSKMKVTCFNCKNQMSRHRFQSSKGEDIGMVYICNTCKTKFVAFTFLSDS